jgi:hypothetical protein
MGVDRGTSQVDCHMIHWNEHQGAVNSSNMAGIGEGCVAMNSNVNGNSAKKRTRNVLFEFLLFTCFMCEMVSSEP